MSKLAVHKRLHLEGGGATCGDPFVRCPAERRWASVDTCRACADATDVDEPGPDPHVRCGGEDADDADRSRAPIAEAMDFEVLTVSAYVAADEVRAALEARELGVAIVLDHDGHAIGTCSRLDLARSRGGKRADAIMSPFVLTLLASAKVSDAIELIVDRGINYIPILAEGRVMGMVSSTSALRSIAQGMGERTQWLSPASSSVTRIETSSSTFTGFVR